MQLRRDDIRLSRQRPSVCAERSDGLSGRRPLRIIGLLLVEKIKPKCTG